MGGKISLYSLNWICHGQLDVGFFFIPPHNLRCGVAIQDSLCYIPQMKVFHWWVILLCNAHNDISQIYQHGIATERDCGRCQEL